MLDEFKKILENNNVISEEIKESIQAAWESRITENRNQVATQLREEFAQKYEHDKSLMVEAVDRMLSEQLHEEIVEFSNDRQQLAEMKVKYAKKMKKDATVMKEFVTRQLASEITELHEDQKTTANKFKALENFVIEALSQEITEFYQDKQDLNKTKVRLIKEGRAEIKKLKEQFVRRSAELVENIVNENLTNEIVTLKEDIEAARRADFGRKLFEAFASEYQASYLNERGETAKLLKVISEKDSAINEAANAVVRAEKLLEAKQIEIRKLQESQKRKHIMSELLSPLNGEQRELMGELMETVPTSKLNESFEKYLPTVIADRSTSRKQALIEAKAITGNKQPSTNRSSELDYNILDIRRLAGLQI